MSGEEKFHVEQVRGIVELVERPAFGIVRFAPANALAGQLAAFIKQTTFTDRDIRMMKELGFVCRIPGREL